MTVPSADVLDRVLSGEIVRVSSSRLGARIASSLLSDLGATVTMGDDLADLADPGARVSDTGVTLSSYGLHGEFRDAPETDQAVMAIGGALAAQWSYRPGPVYLLTPFPSAAQGILSATALLARRLSGAGTEVRGDVSALHALFALQSGGYGRVQGVEPDRTRWRHTPRGQQPTYATYQTADGLWLFVGASTRPFMIRTLQTLGLDAEIPEVPPPGKQPFDDVPVGTGIWKQMADVFASAPRQVWLDRFAKSAVPIGPVLSTEDALSHVHVKTLGLTGADLRPRNLVQVRRESDAPLVTRPVGTLPLAGLRVLEVTGYIAGSYVGRLLADLGADVVKVEAPGGDPFRRTGGSGLGFISWNYGKRGMSRDLAVESDKDNVFDLIRGADIFVTNYRADSLDKLGLGRSRVFEANPGLIHCSISAFGEGGPLSHLQGFDPIVQAFVGVQARQGADGEPVKSQMAATDYMAAMLAVLGIVSARTRQVVDGGGYSVSTSLLAAALLLVFDAAETLHAGRGYTRGGLDYLGPSAVDGLHQCADGWLLAVGNPSVSAEIGTLGSDVLTMTVGEAIARFAEAGISAIRCLEPDELVSQPHCSENNLWTEFEQPGLGRVTIPAPVFRKTGLTGPAPALDVEPDLSSWFPERHVI
jgi:crotonobetainyl-CoA:carnitine CoA-transferase CaiB-like acyl-CoA transferase